MPASSDVTVAVYYFPNYHTGETRADLPHGAGGNEWKLLRDARPRFPGHQQPKVPLWGETDEADPVAMARKIDAAAEHGIDAFIFDWYWYDGPFLERGLNDGFLQAANRERLKFSLMWANHDWLDLFPATRKRAPVLAYPGALSRESFERLCDHVIERYFLQPNYWKIDGRPYFSIYEISRLIDSFGGVGPTREALDRFRARAEKAGLPGIHFNAVTWAVPFLPGTTATGASEDVLTALGFDSVTSYVWIHHFPLREMQTDFEVASADYFAYAARAAKLFSLPYFPNVSMGWDPSPRAHQEEENGDFGYPFMNTISGNTPGKFQAALARADALLQARATGPRVLTINSWNEWTEGSYLEPDTVHGMGYLEAIKTVFGPR